jgi:hypothetical protein
MPVPKLIRIPPTKLATILVPDPNLALKDSSVRTIVTGSAGPSGLANGSNSSFTVLTGVSGKILVVTSCIGAVSMNVPQNVNPDFMVTNFQLSSGGILAAGSVNSAQGPQQLITRPIVCPIGTAISVIFGSNYGWTCIATATVSAYLTDPAAVNPDDDTFFGTVPIG